jgi:hypothetical protein
LQALTPKLVFQQSVPQQSSHLRERKKIVAIRSEHRTYGLISSHTQAIRNNAASSDEPIKIGLGSNNTSVQASTWGIRRLPSGHVELFG